MAGLGGSSGGICPEGVIRNIALIALDGEYSQVGSSVVGKEVVQFHFHPAGGIGIREGSAIDQGVAVCTVVAAGQAGLAGVLHIDADSLDGTYIGAAALVEAQIPDVAGGADLRSQIDSLMAGVVPITVYRIRLGFAAVAYDDGRDGIGGGEACNNVRGVRFLSAVDGCYVILIAGFVHHVCIRVSQSAGAGQIVAIAVNPVAAWCSGGRGLPVKVHDSVAGSGGQVLGRGIVGAHGREDDVIQPGAVAAIGPGTIFGIGPGQSVAAGRQGVGSLCPACGTRPLAFLYAIDVETQKVIVALGGYLIPEAEIARAADHHRQAEGGAAVVGDGAGLGGIGAGKDL